MNRLVVMTVAAASLAGWAVAAEPAATNALVAAEGAAEAEEPAELEEEETKIFEAGFDFDYFSAYVWRNTVSSDDMVMQPAVWADLTYFEPFWLGFSIWQNYDITDRRCEIFRYGINETDYNVHLGATAWSTEDEAYSLGFEIGHEWYTYYGVRDGLRDAYPDTRELYVKATFDNPFVNVYGQASWMYDNFGAYRNGLHYEIGFNREIEIVESLKAGVDWNVNFGDGRYLQFLYGGTSNPYYEENEDGVLELYDDYDGGTRGGFAGTTVKIYLDWAITDWLSLGGTVAYTGVLNGPYREALGDQGGDYWMCGNEGESYPRDLFWGGFSLRLSF